MLEPRRYEQADLSQAALVRDRYRSWRLRLPTRSVRLTVGDWELTPDQLRASGISVEDERLAWERAHPVLCRADSHQYVVALALIIPTYAISWLYKDEFVSLLAWVALVVVAVWWLAIMRFSSVSPNASDQGS